ncbi:MAG: hypothetical protein U0441_01080 [Polyangiaceae bacterium]
MALIACVNCGWMCNETDAVCNMCGGPTRVRAPAPVWPAPQQPPWVPPPIGISSGSRPDPSMLWQPPPPPPNYPDILPPLGRLLLNRPLPESELADNPRLACIDCGHIVGNRPAICPKCGLAPDQDSIHARKLAELLERTFRRCTGVGAWTLDKWPRPTVWTEERRLIEVLRDCLLLDGGQPAIVGFQQTEARIEIRSPDGACPLAVDAARGRIASVGPDHEIVPSTRFVLLREPRRLFRWLTWVGLKGLDQFTA